MITGWVDCYCFHARYCRAWKYAWRYGYRWYLNCRVLCMVYLGTHVPDCLQWNLEYLDKANLSTCRYSSSHPPYTYPKVYLPRYLLQTPGPSLLRR